MTLKEIRQIPSSLVREFPHDVKDVNEWIRENQAAAILFSVGICGRNGALIIARKTGTLYRIIGRRLDLMAF